VFFYDLGSPYAWLAAERIHAVLGSAVEWVPVLLGGLFKATGRGSWAHTEQRAAGILEIERRCEERGLPRPRWPYPWPNDGLRAMRTAVWAHSLGRGELFARTAFRVHFVDGMALSEPAGLELAAERAGLNPAALDAATADPAVKARLRANTDDALAAGVVGVPAVTVGGEVFWGDDRLEDAARALRRSR
jgi:2-hydroxychromene-2-carboxylate isomerase